MFESVAASILNRVLGDYVANLSQEQLSLGIMSGNAKLSDLKLKPDALQQLQLPIDVAEGSVGQLTMQIPWASLKTKPVVIHIQDILVLAGPRSKFVYDPAQEIERALKKKLSKLDTFELVQASVDTFVNEDTKGDSFFSHLTTRILNNLQITIENVHIRYEDAGFACGVCIERLTALSTNENWEEAFVVDFPMYKLASLEKLSIYFDCKSTKTASNDEMSDLNGYFSDLSFEKATYLLHPISTTCKLVIQQNYTEELPKILVNLDLPSINLALEETQYHTIMQVAETFLLLERSLRYLPIRDEMSKVDVKFAVRCIQSDLKTQYKNRNWDYLVQRRTERKMYVDSFVSRLNSSETSRDTEVLSKLEKSLELVDLRFFRSLARQIRKAQPQAAGSSVGGYLSWASSWIPGSQPTSPKVDLTIKEEDVSKIYDAVDFSESTTSLNATIPRNYITLTVKAKLDSLVLDVFGATGEKVFDVNIAGFSVDFVKWPKNFSVDAAVKDLSVEEGLLKNSLYPTIIKKRSTSDDTGLLHISYTDHVDSAEFDSKLTVRSEPLEIVYSHASFDLLISFFSLSKESALNQMFLKSAEDSITNLTNQTKSALERLVQTHKAINFDINLKAPLLILPLNCTKESESVFALDLGHLECSSQFIESARREIVNPKIEKGVFNKAFYDLLLVHLSKASILFSYHFEENVEKFDEVLRDIDLSLKVYDTFLPKSTSVDLVPTIVFGNVPPLCLNISDHKYRQFMKLLDIISPPKFVAPVTQSIIEETHDEFYDSFESAVNLEALERKSVEVRLEFDNIRCVVSEDEDSKGRQKELLALNANKLHVEVSLCPKTVDVDIILKSFNVHNPDLEVIKGIGLEADGSLLNIHVRLVDLDHPLFAQAFNSTKFHVDFNISAVSLAIRPRTFVSDIQYILRTFVDDDPIRMAAQSFDPIPTKKHVKGSLKQFIILFRDEDNTRGEAIIEDARAEIMFMPESNSVYAGISEFELWNRTPIPAEAFNCPFLKLKEGSSLEITYNFSDLPLYGDEMCTSEMIVKSGSPIIAYMPQFLEELLAFINVLKTIKPPSANRPPEATRMTYNIHLDSPVLELPCDMDVIDMVCLFFGNIAISNRFEAVDDKDGSNQFIEGDITDIRAEYHCSGEKVCNILEKSFASLSVTQLWKANSQGKPNNQITIKTDSLNFSIESKKVYTMFLDQILFLIGTVNQAVMPIFGPALPFYDEETGKPIYTSHIRWDIGRIHLELLENKSLFSKLCLHDNYFEMDSWSNMVMKMHFPSAFFEVQDYSVPDNVFAQIIEPVKSGSGSVNNEPFAITFERTSSLEADLRISLAGLKIIFFVDLIFKLKSYIVESWPKPRPPREGVSPPVQGPPQKMCVELANSILLLVEDYKRAESECCKLSIDSLTYNLKVNWNMACKGLWASLCNMNDLSGTELEILDSLDAVWVGEVENASDQRITLDITPIYFHVSYEDLLYVVSIFKQAKDRYTSQQSTEPPQEEVMSTTSFKKLFSFKLASFRFSLIDDISKTNIPFADLIVEKIAYESLNDNNELSGLGSFLVAANFFNLENSHWEPLLEAAEMEIVVKPGDNTNNCDTFYEFKSPVNFNLSSTFISAFYDLMNRTTADGEKTNLSAIREVSKPYLITNQTGYALNVWCDSRDTDNDRIATVKSGESLPWSFKNWKDSRKSQESAFNTLAIHILESEWQTIRGLPVDRESFYMIELLPAIDPKKLVNLVIEVVIHERLKEIVLRSPHSICNLTKFPIEVSVIGTGSIGPSVFSIQPDSSHSLPLDNLHSGMFRVRPAEQGFEYSEKMIPAKEFFSSNEDEEELFLQEKCRNADSSTAPFYFTITNSSDSNEARSGRGLIYVEASLEVVNLLPMDIRFRAYDIKAGIDFGGSIKKGSSAPFHAVDTGHALGFSLEIDGTDWKSSEVANINSPSGIRDEIDGILLLKNSAGSELSLCTRVVCTNRCQRCIMIYAPYVILNRSLLDLEFVASSFFSAKTTHNIFWSLHATEGPTDPLLYSFPDMDSLKNKVRIRAEQASEWSQPLSLDKVGGYMEVNLQNKSSLSWYNLMLTTKVGLGQYSCVKLVHVSPQFMVKNQTTKTIFIRGGPESLLTEVLPKTEMPLHFDPACFESVRMALDPMDGGWSAGFSVTNTGRDVVKVKGADGKEMLLRVVRELHGGTWFMHLSVEKHWPMVLKNSSGFTLLFSQKGVAGKKYKVEPESSCPFAWDEPLNGEKMIILEVQEKMRNINPNEIGQLLPLTVKDPSTGERINLSLSVAAQGPQIIITVQTFDSRVSYYKNANLSETNTTLSDEAMFEEKSITNVTNASTTVRVPFLGVSFIQENGEELVYLSLRSVEFRQTQSNLHSTLGLSIGWLQLDNQSFDWQVPIIFYPTNISNAKTGGDEEEALPFIKMAVIKLLEEEYGIDCYRYFGFLMQECSVELTEEMLKRLVAFMPKPALGRKAAMYRPEELLPPRANDHITGSDATSYFEVFQLHPMRVNFSFSKTESDDKRQGFAVYNPLTAALEIVMLAIGQVSDASLKYNALVLENTIISRSTLGKLVLQNYKNETIGQFHKLLGSADMFGNPAGLFQNFSSGVSDFFYEPYNGFVSDRPQDIGIGLVKGTASLFQHTIFGLSDSFSKFTGSLGRGVAAATFDKSYQRKRRVNRARNKPRHALEGIASGTMQLISGVTSGVAGLVEKPVEMTRKDGATGFFKGVGLGVVGLITKPIVGVLDLTTSVGEGIRGSADGVEVELMPARLPRPVPFDNVLRPYDAYEAQGQSILLASIGKRRKDRYVGHIAKLGGDDAGSALFLTTKRLVLLRLGSKRILWALSLTSVYKMGAQGQVLMIDDAEGNRIMLMVEENLEWFMGRYQLLPKVKQINRNASCSKVAKPKQ